MEASKKTSVIVLASVGAAAAGIAVVVAVAKWRERNLGGGNAMSLRSVQDVLSDCYRKIDEIERSLPASAKSTLSHNNGASAKIFRVLTNGSPALESGA